MADTILGGDFTVYYSTENNQRRIVWTGSATGTRTCNEFYSALLKLFDDSPQMDDKIPIQAVTPDIYRIINQWFIDDTSVEHLIGGSIFTQGWVDGTDEHVLMIGADFATAFSEHDIGRTIRGLDTTHSGTLLDFNSQRGLLWVRPIDPTVAGDTFNHPTEAYNIMSASAVQVWQVDISGAPDFVDQTSNFNDPGPGNLTFFPASEASGDYCAFGFAQPFSKLVFDNAGGTPGVAGTVNWEYWNGTAWTSISATDNTTAFTAGATDQQTVTWPPPSDWATLSLNSGPTLYYVRAAVAGVYSTNPIYDEGFVGGQGAGNFQIHGRHGGASAAGESAWAGIVSIGAIQDNTEAYIFQENPNVAANTFNEVKVLATKGSDVWWPREGHLNMLIKTKEAGSVFGPNPSLVTEAIATFFMRQYSKSYSHFIGTALKTAGGNTVVPFATADDLDNTTGHKELSTDADSGTWGSSDVDTVIQEVGNTNNKAIITAISGTTPNFGIKYYLIYTQEDFADNDVLEDEAQTKTLTVFGAPQIAGPEALNITPVFGATTEDINNGAGARPFSIRVDPASNPLADVYERLKLLTRRGSTSSLQGQDGEEYLGNDIQIQYTTMFGSFEAGTKLYDQTTNAEGILVADHNDGATGDVILKATRGTFTANNLISSSPSPTGTLAAALQVEDSTDYFVIDVTATAQSPGGADTLPFPATEEIGDYFAIGSIEPFSSASFDIATAGTDGVALWEYWSGAAWSNLESTPGFADITDDFKSGTGIISMSFAPPLDWLPTTIASGTTEWGPFYYVRSRVTTPYTVNPIISEILLADNMTASIASTRTIVPISVAPFGTLAGGKFFGAPGVTLTTTNLASGEEQSYQLIDDDGNTQVPPNTVSITVDNLISGDAVSVFRRTGTAINKTQFTLDSGNTIGLSTVIVDTTIAADNPTNANSKIRAISAGGQEHRYRYASYAGVTFTLSAASAGTDDGGGSTTTITDSGATFDADGVEVGDMVRNTTNGVYSVVTAVATTTLTVTSNGTTWASKGYSVNTLVESYALGLNAYVPLIERIADATSESNQLVFSTGIAIRAVVRRSSTAIEILPFEQDTTVTGNLTVTAIRNSDDIIT